MKIIKVSLVLMILVILTSCTSQSEKEYPQEGIPKIDFVSEDSCELTDLKPIFIGKSEPAWEAIISESALQATNIIRSPEFSLECQHSRMSRTRGRTVQEVCREVICSGVIRPQVGFYNNPNTRAIAYEDDGALYINVAKFDYGAGSPGNIAHEFAHTLGYTHFTNWAFFGKRSVPYVVGRLVEAKIKE